MSYGQRLQEALDHSGKGRKALAEAIGRSVQAVGDVINGKSKAFTAENNAKAAEFLKVNSFWLATGDGSMVSDTQPTAHPAPAPHEAPSDALGAPPDLVITEFDTGGGMDTTGRLLLDDQPGTIKSWRVTHEWLRLNVPTHTGIRNLCIVTGFGPSMRPMFNPGDPLLVDTGVKTVTHEGVYFFRVGDEGYIKMIQRVPDPHGDGVMLNIISKNPDYPPYPMSPRNPHFEVLGKVLTVWRSEQY